MLICPTVLQGRLNIDIITNSIFCDMHDSIGVQDTTECSNVTKIHINATYMYEHIMISGFFSRNIVPKPNSRLHRGFFQKVSVPLNRHHTSVCQEHRRYILQATSGTDIHYIQRLSMRGAVQTDRSASDLSISV